MRFDPETSMDLAQEHLTINLTFGDGFYKNMFVNILSQIMQTCIGYIIMKKVFHDNEPQTLEPLMLSLVPYYHF